MNKTKIYSAVVCVVLVLSFFVSCRTNPSTIAEKDRLRVLLHRDTVGLDPAKAEVQAAMDMQFSLIDFRGDDAPALLVRELLYGGMEAAAYLEKVKELHKSEYRLSVEGNAPDYPSEAMNWYYHEKTELEGACGSVMVLSHSLETYSGGAHGAREKSYFVISLEKQGNARRLGLEDIFKQGEEAALQRLIEAELRVWAELPPDTPLSQGIFFEDAAPPPENFFPDSNGLTFYWNQYEIAPYAAGPVEVRLSWESVLPLLSNEGVELSKTFSVKN